MLLAKIGGFACTCPTLARSSPGAHGDMSQVSRSSPGVDGDVFMREQMVFSTFLRLSPRSAIASICLFASKLDVHHLESVIVVPHSLLSRYSTSDQLVKTREFCSRKGTTGNLETRVSGLKLELTLRFFGNGDFPIASFLDSDKCHYGLHIQCLVCTTCFVSTSSYIYRFVLLLGSFDLVIQSLFFFPWSRKDGCSFPLKVNHFITYSTRIL